MLDKILKLFKYIFYILFTLPRDLRAFLMVRKIERMSREVDKANWSVTDYYQRWLQKQPNKPCLIQDDKKWTFRDVNKKKKTSNFFYTVL